MKAKTKVKAKTKAKRGGRPPVDRPTGRKVTVYMLPETEERARAVGEGNLSRGVAVAVDAAWKSL